jgi:uncharacterized protein YjiS (DUF1127 family)
MSTQTRPYPRVSFLIDTFADWLKHRRELNEMRQLDRTEFDRIAADLEISSGDLGELVRRGPHAADELLALLKTLGIDEARLENAELPMLRDMERVCSVCNHKARCDHDLAGGTAARHYREYCPNAATIKELEPTAK